MMEPWTLFPLPYPPFSFAAERVPTPSEGLSIRAVGKSSVRIVLNGHARVISRPEASRAAAALRSEEAWTSQGVVLTVCDDGSFILSIGGVERFIDSTDAGQLADHFSTCANP